jgi:hypothetical protein
VPIRIGLIGPEVEFLPEAVSRLGETENAERVHIIM